MIHTKSLYFLVFRSVTKISPLLSCFRRITLRFSKSSVLNGMWYKTNLKYELILFFYSCIRFSKKQNHISLKKTKQMTYSLSPAIVIVSKNKFGSMCSLASLCQFAKSCMGFSGGFWINDKPDVSMSVHCNNLHKYNHKWIFSLVFIYFFYCLLSYDVDK